MSTDLWLCKAPNSRTVEIETARFHGFFQGSEIVPPSMMIGGHNGGTLYFPVALVEFADGHFETLRVNDVTMLHYAEAWEKEEKRATVDIDHLF
ncbi:MAG: hypothetical protein IJ153_05405 [Clostridia bacterium]|nr:hypothetical protein [Clostridia bacterium]